MSFIPDSTLRKYGFDPEQFIRSKKGIDNFIDIYPTVELANQAPSECEAIEPSKDFSTAYIFK
ncbi:MAG: hypothetical protein HKM04_07500 [Legionellales bacterium]|nr:hypothetical protein [Legionellales bacterium]